MIKKLFLSVLAVSGTLLSVAALPAQAGVGFSSHERIIPGHYIVVLKDTTENVEETSLAMGKAYGLSVEQEYHHVIKGFAATIPATRLSQVKEDSRVLIVSEDREVYMDGKPSIDRGGVAQPTQIVPSGVRRIGAPTNNVTGKGVGIAVIDTGIDLTHPDLVSNIGGASKTCVSGTRSANDDNGHGTHVAGTIAASNNTIGVLGVAPEATLYPVKVLNKNGSGTWSSVICGIDWVTAHAAQYGISVANMSLGGGGVSDNNCGLTNNDALHQAICRSIAAGVTYVVAAGNEGSDAAGSVPAAYDDAVITVSALVDSDGLSGGSGSGTTYGADDTFASFSNYGAPVDVGAPGVNILSTWKGSGYNTISGTSMATPHVTGVAALYLAAHPGALWTEVKQGLISGAEFAGFGHTDPSGLHPEGIVRATAL